MPAHRLPDHRIPVLLSAHEEDLIGQDATAILDYLQRLTRAEDPTARVASTLLRTRRVHRHRAVVRAADRAELEVGLRAVADGKEHPLVARSSRSAPSRTTFVFPGQGNQWPSMGAEAYQRVPAYRVEAQRCAEAFTAAGLASPLAYLLTDADGNWSQIDIQSAQFTHAASLAQVWRSCGVLPDITVGHSLGEVAAAYVAGVISLPDAVAVVVARARVVGQLPGRYGMAVLGVSVDRAEEFLAETPGWLEVSVVNSPSSCVVSGDRDAIADIVRRAEEDGIFVRELAVDYPAHTSKLESLRDTMADMLPASSFVDAPVEFASSARGGVVDADTDFGSYWYENLRNTVRFDDAVATAVERGAGKFVEMSAHPWLVHALTELAEDALVVGSGCRDESLVEQLSTNVAAAAVADPGYRWPDLVDVSDPQVLWGFPAAPMQAIYLWATPEPLPPAPGTVLSVSYEEWEPRADNQPIPNDQPPCRIAIVVPDTADDPLASRLTEAVATRHECELANPDEAEISVMIAPTAERSDVMGAVEQLPRAMRQLDYRRAVGPRCRRVWLVTAGGERVHPDSPFALPAQAALAAMHRSVGFEFSDRTFAHLDLPSREIDADTVDRCIDMLLGEDTEVAVRDGGGPRCCIRTLRESDDSAPAEAFSTAELENVVITGGSGTIGLRYARHCIEHGAKSVILLSRKGVGPPEIERLTAGYPAEVHAPACDITDEHDLAVVAEKYAGDGASLLIHTAGIAKFGPHDQLADADLTDVFSAKVVGLIRMTDIWPLRPDARILLCSSVSGVWGGYGHAAYAAANRMLDTLAGELRAKGLDCVALRWGLWRGTTIAEADEIARIERSGLVAMDPEAAVAASLRHHPSDPLILAADFDRLRMFFESQGASMPFTVDEIRSDADAPAEVANGDERSVTDVVRTELAAALNLDDPAAVDLSVSLVSLGVDSMLALDLRDRLRRGTGQSVPAAQLLSGINGAELIETLQSGQSADPEKLGRLESSCD